MSITTTRPASSRLNSFARDAVFAAFGPQQARAIDQGAFTDHSPQQIRCLRSKAIARRQTVLDRLAAALLLGADDADDDAEPSAA